MYYTLELFTVVGVVVAAAVILFVVSTAFIALNEGMRSALEVSARYVRPLASF
jgi:hypothetical protein